MIIVTIRLDATMLDRLRGDGFLAFETGLCPDYLATLQRTLTELHRRNAGFPTDPVLPQGFSGGDARIHALECVSDFDSRAAVFCLLPPGGCVIHTPGTVMGLAPTSPIGTAWPTC